MKRVCVREVTKVFKTRKRFVAALDRVNLEFGGSEFVGLIGPNACGKTTLLLIIAGVERPTSGSVEFTGFKTARPVVPMIFQNTTLLPWRIIETNVELPPEFRGVSTPIRKNIARRFIEFTKLGGFEGHYPGELSGGMKRRAEIARALAAEEEILVMDEPFHSLDAQARLLMQEELLRLWEETRKAILYVTHDLQEAILLCDRIAVMTSRPGRVKEIVDVGIPRPRSIESMGHPKFSSTLKYLWALLREEAEKSMMEVREEEVPSRKRRSSRFPFSLW